MLNYFNSLLIGAELQPLDDLAKEIAIYLVGSQYLIATLPAEQYCLIAVQVDSIRIAHEGCTSVIMCCHIKTMLLCRVAGCLSS